MFTFVDIGPGSLNKNRTQSPVRDMLGDTDDICFSATAVLLRC